VRGGWIAVGLVVAITGCERPMEPRPAPPKPASAPATEAVATRPRPNLHWSPTDLQGLAAAVTPCGAQSIDWYDQEAAAIAQTGRARRRGDVLTVGKVSFINQQKDPDDAGMVGYSYVGTYGDSGVDAVFAQYYEGFSVSLVDERNDATIIFIDLPLASPDGRYFAAASTSEYDGYGVQIVERTPGGWVERARYDESTVHSPCGLVWTPDGALTVRVRWSTEVPDPDLEWSTQLAELWGPAHIVRTGASWRYEAPKR
jgi:hypothetical protein